MFPEEARAELPDNHLAIHVLGRNGDGRVDEFEREVLQRYPFAEHDQDVTTPHLGGRLGRSRTGSACPQNLE